MATTPSGASQRVFARERYAVPKVNSSFLSVDARGTHAVLGMRRGIAVVALDDLSAAPRKFLMRRNAPYSEFSLGQYARNPEKPEYIAAAAGDHVVLWDIGAEKAKVESIPAHSRSVTDLDWSWKRPDLLCSCSHDSQIKLWDTRQRRSTVAVFDTWADSTRKARFARHHESIVATAHGGEVRLWDIRNPASPTDFITAHTSRILGMDWVSESSRELVTGSEDGGIRYWDANSPRVFQHTIAPNPQADAPVCCIVSDPHEGVVAAQLGRRNATVVLLSKGSSEVSSLPAIAFEDTVKDVVVLVRNGAARVYALNDEHTILVDEIPLPKPTEESRTADEESAIADAANEKATDAVAAARKAAGDSPETVDAAAVTAKSDGGPDLSAPALPRNSEDIRAVAQNSIVASVSDTASEGATETAAVREESSARSGEDGALGAAAPSDNSSTNATPPSSASSGDQSSTAPHSSVAAGSARSSDVGSSAATSPGSPPAPSAIVFPAPLQRAASDSLTAVAGARIASVRSVPEFHEAAMFQDAAASVYRVDDLQMSSGTVSPQRIDPTSPGEENELDGTSFWPSEGVDTEGVLGSAAARVARLAALERQRALAKRPRGKRFPHGTSSQIPAPRRSGAVFSRSGHLVVFTSPEETEARFSACQTYDDVLDIVNRPPDPSILHIGGKISFALDFLVECHLLTSILPVSMNLARSLVHFHADPVVMLSKSAAAAASAGRQDAADLLCVARAAVGAVDRAANAFIQTVYELGVQAENAKSEKARDRLLGTLARAAASARERPAWLALPLSGRSVRDVARYFLLHDDIQMASIIAVALDLPQNRVARSLDYVVSRFALPVVTLERKPASAPAAAKRSRALHPAAALSAAAASTSERFQLRRRSPAGSSAGVELDTVAASPDVPLAVAQGRAEDALAAVVEAFDVWRGAPRFRTALHLAQLRYAQVLRDHGMLQEHAQVLTGVRGQTVDETVQEGRIYCVLTHRPVQGMVLQCWRCGHGGDVAALLQWRRSGHTQCPAGCACECSYEPDRR